MDEKAHEQWTIWIIAATTVWNPYQQRMFSHTNTQCEYDECKTKLNGSRRSRRKKKRMRCIHSNVQIEFNNYTKGNVKTFWRQFINTRTNNFIMYSELPPIFFFLRAFIFLFISFLYSSLFSCFICLIDKCIRTRFSFNKSRRFMVIVWFVFYLLPLMVMWNAKASKMPHDQYDLYTET